MERRALSKSRAAAVLVLAIVIAMTVAVVDDRDEAQAATIEVEYTYNKMVFIALDGFEGMKLIRCDDKTVENLTIPAQVSSRAVTTIGSGAFVGCDDLKTISIPASVKKIDPGAFGTCKNLEKISVSSGNTSFSTDDQGVL